MLHTPHKRTIILARHGSTNLNDDGDKIRGWKDVPLNDHGIKQAHALGKELKKETFDVILTSDLQRATKTADIISKETGKPVVEKTKALRPWDVGKFTGMESKIAIPQMMDFVDHPDKKVPDGESFDTFKIRFLHGIRDILKKYPDKKLLLVSHHRNDRLMDAWTQGTGGDHFDMKTFVSKGIPPAGFIHYNIFVQ